MARRPGKRTAAVGVVESANTAVLVTLDAGGGFLDRREVVLTEPGLSTHPHHHEGSWAVGRYLDSPWARRVSLADALALVEQVRASAQRGAGEALEELASTIGKSVAAISLRVCPRLPASTEAIIRDHRAQTVADSVMYRRAIAVAAEARGWVVHWYEPVWLDPASRRVVAIGDEAGPPWQAKHKLAAAAALRVLRMK